MPATVVRKYDTRRDIGGAARVGESPIAASQTFTEGDVLVANSSGLAAAGAAAGSRIAAISGITNLVFGVANANAQPTSGDPTQPYTKLSATYGIAEPGTQFRMPLYSATPSSAYPNPNKIGLAYECINVQFPSGTGGNTLYAVDLDHTTNVVLCIVDYLPTDYPGWPKVGQATPPSSGTTSQYCGCWIEFITDATMLGRATITRS